MGSSSSYRPLMVMITLQCAYSGLVLFTKTAFTGGLSPRVLVVYRQAVATLIMVPIACFSRRGGRRSINPGSGGVVSLTLESFSWIFAAAFFGVTLNQNAYFEGINLSNSTVASAMTDLIPAITFLLAAILRMEIINMRSLRSGAKILGTFICVCGAMAMAFLKGPKLLNDSPFMASSDDKDWLMGCLLLFAASFFWSLWLIFQVPIATTCPDLMYSSTWLCFLATLQSTIVALFLEKDVSAWKLDSTFELSCCLYSGAVLTMSFVGQAWCVSERGPIFTAIFNPLCTVITAIFAAIFLHEKAYIGELMGAVAVIMGLYLVLWGKAKDLEKTKSEKEKTSIGLVLFTKAAFTGGMSPRVLVVYRQAVATLIMVPVACFSRRRRSSGVVSLTMGSFSWIFAAALFGVTLNQNAYFEGINLSNSTIASAMTDLIPAITFTLAAILRMEMVSIRSLRSGAKFLGTFVCVGGAMAMAFLKGPKLLNESFMASSDNKDWFMGCLLLFAASFCWSLWIIFQIPIGATCPDLVYSSTWLCFLATLQSAIVALFLENDVSAWKLHSIFELGCCLYSGAVLIMSFVGQAWCVSQRGPIFTAISNPLCTVTTAIFAATFLHEKVYTGELMGAVAVIMGLYMVLWGKAKDLGQSEKKKEKDSIGDLEEPFVTSSNQP
ncbi:unnamed protein product [Linum trigynum]|uniref:EamA domain-containing protein n=1 Tax=Linum trigynum TaxID=586398 RepID=A0AAV2GXK4_9ROSI